MTYNKKAKWICIEGVEGVGKTTQTQLLVDTLRSRGFSVLQTKEPGTPLVPLTMVLRGIMLDNQYDAQMTKTAREFISQAIRSIHLEQLIVPNLNQYDFIVQDRGILSGYAYGMACNNEIQFLRDLSEHVVAEADIPNVKATTMYDTVVYLRGDSKKGLALAKAAKQEFVAGDAIESRGENFIERASTNMSLMSESFNTVNINVDGKSIQDVHAEILACLRLGK